MKRAIIQPQWIFLILAAVFGSLLAVAAPPGQAPDEYQHFGRAYMLSEGQLFPVEAMLPKGITRMLAFTANLPFHIEQKISLKGLWQVGNKPVQPKNRLPKPLPASSVFSPLPYLASAAGIWLGRVFGLPPLALFSLGRMCNLGVWIVLGFLTLRTTPIFKWVFFLLLLSPMSLHLAGSYSADSLTIALSFLWLSICLWLALGAGRVTWIGGLLLLLFAFLLPLAKPPYALLLGAAIIIPTVRYPGLRISGFPIPSAGMRAAALSAVFILGSALFIASANINREYYAAMLPIPGIDSMVQIVYVLRHPFNFLLAVLQTLRQDGPLIFQGTVGILGWLDTRLPNFVYWLHPLAILLAALLDSQLQPILRGWQKLVLGLTGLATFLMVAAGLYVTWTPVGAPKVSDIQGRYLIPIVPFLLLGLSNQRLAAQRRLLVVAAPLYAGLVLGITLWAVMNRYYTIPLL